MIAVLEMMRELRKQKKMTLKQLADIIGVAEVTVSTYERGTREPPLSVLCAIADALDVSLDVLVRGKRKEPLPEDGERLKDLIAVSFSELSPQERKIAEAVLTALLSQQEQEVVDT